MPRYASSLWIPNDRVLSLSQLVSATHPLLLRPATEKFTSAATTPSTRRTSRKLFRRQVGISATEQHSSTLFATRTPLPSHWHLSSSTSRHVSLLASLLERKRTRYWRNKWALPPPANTADCRHLSSKPLSDKFRPAQQSPPWHVKWLRGTSFRSPTCAPIILSRVSNFLSSCAPFCSTSPRGPATKMPSPCSTATEPVKLRRQSHSKDRSCQALSSTDIRLTLLLVQSRTAPFAAFPTCVTRTLPRTESKKLREGVPLLLCVETRPANIEHWADDQGTIPQ